MPGLTITSLQSTPETPTNAFTMDKPICQSSLYLPVRDFEFGLLALPCPGWAAEDNLSVLSTWLLACSRIQPARVGSRRLTANTVFTGQFQREHRTNASLPADPFTREQKRVVENAIKQLDTKLKACGKETLPTHLYQFFTGSTP
jgi:hypothetical protein